MGSQNRHGVTLIELIVVLVILGIIATVVGFTMQTTKPQRPTDAIEEQITALRTRAITSGQSVTGFIVTDTLRGTATAHPDGSVFSTIGNIEPTTGRTRATK